MEFEEKLNRAIWPFAITQSTQQMERTQNLTFKNKGKFFISIEMYPEKIPHHSKTSFPKGSKEKLNFYWSATFWTRLINNTYWLLFKKCQNTNCNKQMSTLRRRNPHICWKKNHSLKKSHSSVSRPLIWKGLLSVITKKYVYRH